MRRDPLSVLLRVRRLAVDDARAALAAALRHEGTAASLTETAVRMLAQEAEAGRDNLAAFTAWLPHGQEAARNARAGLAAAQRATDQARAALGTAQGAAHVVERVLEQRHLTRQEEAERRSQAALDEVAQTFVSAGDKMARDVLKVPGQHKQDI
jgi:hypothetical protein